jgi:PKD repeat protein
VSIIRIPSVVVTPATGGPTLPVVNLSANPTSGYAPLSVQFTDLSQNAVSRNWDFTNDGTPDSSEPNPIYTYNAVGTYTVNLTANNPNGTASMTTPITVLEATSTGSGGSGGSSGSSHSGGSSRSSHSNGSKSVVISKNGTTSNGTTSNGKGAVKQSGDINLKQDNMTPASIVEPASKENETSTPAKQSKKTPGFVTIFGITGLLIAYLYRRK